MMNITFFSICTARRDQAQQLARHLRRPEQVVELEAHAGNVAFHAVERLRVGHVHQRQAGIVFVHAGLEEADHLELLQARQDRRRRHQPLRRDQRHLVADEHPQGAGELRAEDDAELARLERLHRAAAHVAVEVRHLLLGVGQHAAHQRAAHRLLEGEHALRRNIGRGRQHRLVLHGLFGHLLPGRQLAAGPGDLHVRGDAEDARAQLLLEAVHHRQHDDQRGNTEGDAAHRDQRDEGDEMVAPLGARVAQADEEFILHALC